VGAIVQANGPAGLNDSTAALVVLRRLARKQRPAGDYAGTVVRDAGWPEVYFAFTDDADAKKFAEAVQAELIGTYPGWASQRAFEIDAAKLKELEASLPPPMQPKRPPSYEARLLVALDADRGPLSGATTTRGDRTQGTPGGLVN
jgi:hypothetical protein